METRSHFHAELDALKGRIIALIENVESARRDAAKAYAEHEAPIARKVIDGDKLINRQACDIEETCLRLLALEQPVALDLRRVVGYSRASINLERLADEAVGVAEAALSGPGLPGECDKALVTLAAHTGRMFQLAARAIVDDSLDEALEVCQLDVKARELAVLSMRCITGALSQCQASPETAVRAILATRCFERIGSYAANIAEVVVFILKGVTISQQCQPQ